MLHLKIITPRKVVIDRQVDSVSVPSVNGELTILSHHTNLFSLLKEGIIKIKKGGDENFLAVGGGYLRTDGELLNILVSRAYGQSEINERLTERAIDEAKKILSQSKNATEKAEATTLLRRSIIDSKLLKKRRSRPI